MPVLNWPVKKCLMTLLPTLAWDNCSTQAKLCSANTCQTHPYRNPILKCQEKSTRNWTDIICRVKVFTTHRLWRMHQIFGDRQWYFSPIPNEQNAIEGCRITPEWFEWKGHSVKKLSGRKLSEQRKTAINYCWENVPPKNYKKQTISHDSPILEAADSRLRGVGTQPD